MSIKAVNLRGTWNLDTINDECPICRNSVLETCVECSAATSQTQCISIMGECSHIYHLHCIDKWTKTKNVCPLDNKKWEYKRPQKSIEQSKTCLNCLTPDLDIPIQENQINPDIELIQNIPEPIINIINIPNNNYIINYINTSINTSTTDLSNNIIVGSSTISNNNNYTSDLSNNIFISNLYNNYINTSDLSNNNYTLDELCAGLSNNQQSEQEDDALWSDIDSEDQDDEDYQDDEEDDEEDDDDEDEVWEDIDNQESELDTNNNPTQ